MARIALLLTKTPWADARPFYHQGPALVAAGHTVHYVAAQPDRKIEHPFDYVALSPCDVSLSRRTGGLNLFRRIRRLSPDLVQLCSLELLPLGLALKAFTGIRVVYDCREDMASALYERRAELPRFVRQSVFTTVRFLEHIAARHFDGIVTADPGVFDLHSAMPKSRKHVFFNTALLSQFPAGYPQLEEREHDVVLLGSLSSLRSGAQHLLKAIGILKGRGRSIGALFVGEPELSVRVAIRRAIAEHGLAGQVEVTGHVPHEQVAAQIARGRIGIVPLLDYPKFHTNIACKAFEYMACGMPTIASDLQPQRLFIHEGIGVFYPCGDAAKLADEIEALLEDPARSARMGERARKDVEQTWNAEREQRRYIEFCGGLLSRPLRAKD